MALTVNGLKKWLAENAPNEQDGERLIVLSSDAEGNKFSPLDEPSLQVYRPQSNWDGEVYDDEDAREADVPCIVLWPTN